MTHSLRMALQQRVKSKTYVMYMHVGSWAHLDCVPTGRVKCSQRYSRKRWVSSVCVRACVGPFRVFVTIYWHIHMHILFPLFVCVSHFILLWQDFGALMLVWVAQVWTHQLSQVKMIRETLTSGILRHLHCDIGWHIAWNYKHIAVSLFFFYMKIQCGEHTAEFLLTWSHARLFSMTTWSCGLDHA